MSMTPEELTAFHEKCKSALEDIIDSVQRSDDAMEMLYKQVRRVNNETRILIDLLKGATDGHD